MTKEVELAMTVGNPESIMERMARDEREQRHKRRIVDWRRGVTRPARLEELPDAKDQQGAAA